MYHARSIYHAYSEKDPPDQLEQFSLAPRVPEKEQQSFQIAALQQVWPEGPSSD